MELRYAIRSLIKNPMYSLGIVFALAVGIGGVTTVYSVLRDTVFPTYPFLNVDRLIRVSRSDGLAASFLDYMEWKEDNTLWDELGAINVGASFTWTGHGEPVTVEGCVLTTNIFKMTGIQPFIGRGFNIDEDKPGKPKVVILGYGFWKSRFNADENILGTSMMLNKEDYTIIGVMPANKGFPGNNINLWAPWVIDDAFDDRTSMFNFVPVIGLLKEGLSFDVAYNTLEKSGIAPFKIRRYLIADPYMDKNNILLLFGAVIVLLSVACMNVASLVTARGLVKKKEIALRCAVGATHGKIMRQLLLEPLILSFVGGCGGLLLALAGIKIFYTLKPKVYLDYSNHGLFSSSAEIPILLFAGTITILSVLLFGLIPAFRNSRVNLSDALKPTGESSKGRNVINIRSVFIVMEIAMTTALLLSSGVIVKSFLNRVNIDLGVRWDKNLITLYITNPEYENLVGDYDAYERRYEGNRSIFADQHKA